MECNFHKSGTVHTLVRSEVSGQVYSCVEQQREITERSCCYTRSLRDIAHVHFIPLAFGVETSHQCRVPQRSVPNKGGTVDADFRRHMKQ